MPTQEMKISAQTSGSTARVEVHPRPHQGVGQRAVRRLRRVRLRAARKERTKAKGMAKAVAMKAKKIVCTNSTRPCWRISPEGWNRPRRMSEALENLVRKVTSWTSVMSQPVKQG